jgi:uncharacterized protein (TIGR02145 family)
MKKHFQFSALQTVFLPHTHASLLLLVLWSILFFSCKKNDPSIDNPTNGKTTAIFNANVKYGSMTDQDGNTYKTITIGTQIWMAENLRTTKYNDGTSIQNVTDSYQWEDLTTGAYCNYKNTSNTDTIATYGRLYNWYAVNTGKLAPKGWHVPSDAEWTTLTTYLGGENLAGGKLKESDLIHWKNPNTGATNETGFTALPGGYRFVAPYGDLGLNFYATWWSTSEYDADNAWFRSVWYGDNSVNRDYNLKYFGYSVRCISD